MAKRVSKAQIAFNANLSRISDEQSERLYTSLQELKLWEGVAVNDQVEERQRGYAVEFATDYREEVIAILTALLP